MDRLASEDHSHIATQEEIDVYRGNWWIRVNFDTMPTSTASRKRRTMRTMKYGRTVPPHGGNGKQPGGIPIMRLHHKDGLNTDRTEKPVQSVSRLIICGMNHKELYAKIYRDYIGNSQRSLLSPTGGVKSTSPATENHDKNGYAKVYDDNNIFMSNVDNSDTTYTNKHKNTKYNVRNM